MFSEKYGYKEPKEVQYEKIDPPLRNRIWNVFYKEEINKGLYKTMASLSGERTMVEKITDRLGYPLTAPMNPEEILRKTITQTGRWYDVYDFIDIYLSFLQQDARAQRIEQFNEVFVQEKSGYRIVLGEVTPITNDTEIETVEQAATTQFDSVNQHISKALALYADLKNPDYENSVKESISAVEAMCCIITGLSGRQATLGAALKKLEEHGVHIHKAMENGFNSLYGYASDENGIRHGGIDFKNVPPEDAKYMLVSCSAFVNYLIEKWSKVENN